MPENLEKAVDFLEKLKKENRIKDFAVNKQSDYICIRPFTMLRITDSGDVYTCCPVHINNYSIGNIFKNDLKEIWNCGKALHLRNKILAGDYSMCNLSVCRHNEDNNASFTSLPYPKILVLSYDRECNLRCITCRDEKIINNKKLTDKLYSAVQSVLPYIEQITVSTAGEAFYSKHSRELIKQIASEYKNIKWNILTNGVLFNTENSKILGIYGRINEVLFSLPAIDRKIYNKIMRGSDYDTVMKNIKEAAFEYHNNKTIGKVNIHAVISNLNYNELPEIAEFAKENDLYLVISQCDLRGTEFDKDYKNIAVWEKKHPEFENFKKIIKHSSLNYKRISIAPVFKKIREME